VIPVAALPWPHRRLWHGIGILLIGAVIELSLTPHPLEIGVEHGDKYGHVLAYASLMFWYAQLYAGIGARIGLAIGFVAMAVGLEFLQRLTGYRTFEIADMVAGAIGVATGWIIAPPRSPRVIEKLESRWPFRR
jgi:VanZ family protein